MWKLMTAGNEEVRAGYSYLGYGCKLYTISSGLGQPPNVADGGEGTIYTNLGDFDPRIIPEMRWVRVSDMLYLYNVTENSSATKVYTYKFKHKNGETMVIPTIDRPFMAAKFDQGYDDWQNGQLIQDALGFLTIDEREFIKYGTTDPINDMR